MRNEELLTKKRKVKEKVKELNLLIQEKINEIVEMSEENNIVTRKNGTNRDELIKAAEKEIEELRSKKETWRKMMEELE